MRERCGREVCKGKSVRERALTSAVALQERRGHFRRVGFGVRTYEHLEDCARRFLLGGMGLDEAISYESWCDIKTVKSKKITTQMLQYY